MPDEAPKEVSLVRRVPGVGYTFILAGLLKIMTIGWIATSAPIECVRTAAGQYAQYLLLPIGMLLCFVAKRIVDSGLHENGRFMAFLLGSVALLYVCLPGILYRYEPRTYYAHKRLVAAAQQARTADYRGSGADPRSKFIIQRQMEGQYDSRLRSPDAALAEAEARIPEGVLDAGRNGGAAGAALAAARRPPLPSMYESRTVIPGLDDSE